MKPRNNKVEHFKFSYAILIKILGTRKCIKFKYKKTREEVFTSFSKYAARGWFP